MSDSAFTIAIDFDGTIVENDYPRIGAAVPNAIEWIRRFQEAGANLILLTMRNDGPPARHGDTLTPAIEYCRANGIEFWQVNDNQQQNEWTSSRKVYAHVYIDDSAAGTPLNARERGKPFVDWDPVGPLVLERIEAWKASRMRFRRRPRHARKLVR